MRKILGFIISLVLLSGIYVLLAEVNAIPGNENILQSQKTVYGKGVLYEDIDNHTFGVARLERYLGFLYRYGGGSYGAAIEKDKPFKAIGLAKNEKLDGFIIGVKVSQDSGVKYIAIGNHMEEFLPYGHYELSLDDVRNNPNEYQIKEVKNQYVMFIADEYNEDTWTIRGFDEKGELVADKSYLGDPRYLD